MVKIHTRVKRKFRMVGISKRRKSARPKTFKTEESAKKYAERKGIKSYKLVNLRSSTSKQKKLKIVVE